MLIKGIVDEDFINYKLPSMYIATATCSFKCDKECGRPVCQNSELAKQPTIDIPVEKIIDRYLSNPITHAIVLGGLEPFDQVDEVINLVDELKYRGDAGFDAVNCDAISNDSPCLDPIVIYTGYTKEEIMNMNNYLLYKLCENGQHYWFHGVPNIIVKFGRYIPGQQPHYDPVLGVYLASDNQYAERIS